MTVTITITDPTATEATALRAYLTALHGGTAAAPVATGDRGPELYVPLPGITDPMLGQEPEYTTAEAAGAPDFDSAGMPWDERIHASSRATVADGTWRKKRGVSDELVAEVETELAVKGFAARANGYAEVDAEGEAELATVREQSALEVPNVPEQDQEVPEAPVPEPVASGVTEPTPPAPTTTEDTPPPPPAPTANPFLAVMSRIGKSKLDKAKKDELLTAAGALDEKGAPSILVLNKRPELIDGFIALLDSEGV